MSGYTATSEYSVGGPTIQTHLALGRPASLPAIITGLLAVLACTGNDLLQPHVGMLLIGGMFLFIGRHYRQQAHQVEHDRYHHPDRPVAANLITPSATLQWSWIWLLVGSGLFIAVFFAHANKTATVPSLQHVAWWGMGACLLLSLTGFGVLRTSHVASPWIDAGSRSLMCMTAVLACGMGLPIPALIAIALQLSYFFGCVMLARREGMTDIASSWPVFLMVLPIVYAAMHSVSTPIVVLPTAVLLLIIGIATYLVRRGRPTDVRRAEPLMIAGICLVDAIIIGIQQLPIALMVALFGFFASLALHRRIKRAQ